ncbi:MAG: sulfite exporter TauE/SafE family protein, partial [bacterium]|nr:sulfite exporter TauE/SafE family protein [bacterium]
MIPLDELLTGSYFTDPVMLIGCLLGVGLCIGTLAGLFGVGGGFLTVPILESLFGFNFTISVGSNLASSVGTSAAGASRHGKLGNIEPRTVMLLAMGSIPGALFGTELHQWLHDQVGDGFQQLMRGLFIVLLIVSAWLVWKGPKETSHGKSPLQRLPIGPYIDLPRAGILHVSLPGIISMGMGVGILVGLMGVGGGVLFMPLLVMVVGMSPHQAVGTSLGVV